MSHCCWLGNQLDDKERGVTRKRFNVTLSCDLSPLSNRRRLKIHLNMWPFLLQPTFITLSLNKLLILAIIILKFVRLWYFNLRFEHIVNARLSNDELIRLKIIFRNLRKNCKINRSSQKTPKCKEPVVTRSWQTCSSQKEWNYLLLPEGMELPTPPRRSGITYSSRKE